MNINDIKYELGLAFDKIDDEKYKEIYNYNYVLDYDEEFLRSDIKPSNRGDLKERVELCLEAVQAYEKFMKNDIKTRQCVVHKKYQDKDDLAACISTIQFVVRNEQLDLHVFTRSQNFDNNFDYDNQTYMTILKFVNSFVDVNAGNIHVHVTSLHRYC